MDCMNFFGVALLLLLNLQISSAVVNFNVDLKNGANLTQYNPDGYECQEELVDLPSYEPIKTVSCFNQSVTNCFEVPSVEYKSVKVQECNDIIHKTCKIEYETESKMVKVEVCRRKPVKNCSLAIEEREKFNEECHLDFEIVCETTIEEKEVQSVDCKGCEPRIEVVKVPKSRCFQEQVQVCGHARCPVVLSPKVCEGVEKAVSIKLPKESCDHQVKQECAEVLQLLPDTSMKNSCIETNQLVCTEELGLPFNGTTKQTLIRKCWPLRTTNNTTTSSTTSISTTTIGTTTIGTTTIGTTTIGTTTIGTTTIGTTTIGTTTLGTTTISTTTKSAATIGTTTIGTTTLGTTTIGTTTIGTATIGTTTKGTTTIGTTTIGTTTIGTTTATTNPSAQIFKSGKVLVATGPQSDAKKTEVFDLSNPNNLCKAYPSHPHQLTYATAQILGNKVVICGGYISSVGLSGSCWMLGQSSPFVSLNEKRYLLGSIRLNATHMMLAGGSGSSNSASSTEIVSLSGSSVYGPNMPTPLNGHCFIRINDEKAMLIGGIISQSSNVSSKVWSLDLRTFAWTELPSLNSGRFYHGCGSFTVDNKAYAIVAGGISNGKRSSTTEILDVQSGQSWIDGPTLPFGMDGFQMVTNAQGNGVAIMGGNSDQLTHGDFHELVCDGIICSDWKKLPMTLSVPRANFIALNVPDEFC